MEKRADENISEKKMKSDGNAYWVAIGLSLGVVIGAIPEIGMGTGIPVGLGGAALVDIIITIVRKKRSK